MKPVIDSIRRFFSKKTNKDPITHEIRIRISEPVAQALVRLREKSGVRNETELVKWALDVFERAVDQEIKEGSVELVEPDGINREDLNLLKSISGNTS